ncbi:MAG: hypothetical protein ACFFAN_21290 [Promethearchaeota archaeon]
MIVNQFFLEIFSNFYNIFLPVIFVSLKYSLGIILISFGVLFLLNLKGIYFQRKAIGLDQKNNNLKKIRLILGSLYIIIGFGIIFDYLIYVLIWIFHPFKSLILIIMENLIEDFYYISELIHPFIALGSFIAILQYFLSVYYFVNNRAVINKSHKSVYVLFCSVLEIILFGFECLPYFLL